MKAFRLFLVFVMGLLLFVTVCYPGLYDSKRRAAAQLNYTEAPNDMTRMELENAKRIDRRDLLLCELVTCGLFAVTVYAFVRAGKKIRPIT
jgi:hypothetical protein